MKQKILIIEDESGIADALTYALSTEGFEPLWANIGQDALKMLQNEKLSLIILDLGLPDISGFDLLKEIRKSSDIPVLILTARSEEIDKVLGLELGADDYMVKPFSPRELTARVKAILRRTADKKSSGTPFSIDPDKRQVSYFGEKLILSRYEYEILTMLIRRPGWIYTRNQIMEMIWVEPDESYDRTVDTHIKTIRAKLKKINPDIDPIITHRGVGYSLKEEL